MAASLPRLIAQLRRPHSGPRIAQTAGIPVEFLPDSSGPDAIDYWARVVSIAVERDRLWALVDALAEEIPPRAEELRASAARELAQFTSARARPVGTDPDPAARVDIAIVTVIREEYEAVDNLLAREGQTTHWQSEHGEVNLYAWRLGVVHRAHRNDRPYRVVLAMIGQAGNLNCKDAVRETVEKFKPAFVLLVGIAGGLDRDGVCKGSLAISDLINGYEPGKLEGADAAGQDFRPRLTYTFQVDSSLRTAALGLTSIAPQWHREVSCSPPESMPDPPNAVLGAIASGEKVIDDASRPFFLAIMRQFPKIIAVEMEGAGAASAIHQLREKQAAPCGFLMIRGISDMPRRDSAPSQDGPLIGDAQQRQRDRWKRYAADVAACFAISMIRHTWPLTPRV